MNYLYIDEKGPQETIRVTKPFDDEKKIKLGNDDMRVYMADIIKVSDDALDKINSTYKKLEDEYISKRKFSFDKELKGKDILKGNFQYGIASFRENEMDFYSKLFKLLIENEVDNLLFSINKMSLAINARLVDWIFTLESRRLIQSAILFKYSLTKYCEIEAGENAIRSLFDFECGTKDILTEIQKDMTNFIKKNERNPRMKAQIIAYKEIIQTIRNSKHLARDTPFDRVSFDWDKVKFDFDLWLTEKEIYTKWDTSSCTLILDEGIPSQPFEEFNFSSIKENENSEDHVGLRIVDMLVVVAGNYISRLANDTRYDKDNPTEKKFLSSEWFELNSEQFNLVRSMATFFFNGNFTYCFIHDTYFDDTLLFETFCYYINSFDTFEEYNQILSGKHVENHFLYLSQMAKQKWKLGLENEVLNRKIFGDYLSGIDSGIVRPI